MQNRPITPHPKQPGKMRKDAEPLSPAELIELRRFLRQARELEQHYDASEVAQRLGFKKRMILDLVREGEFPGAWKPAHNQVRIPLSAVHRFIEKRRVNLAEQP